jgi:mono/diheme cytochrome c family protein
MSGKPVVTLCLILAFQFMPATRVAYVPYLTDAPFRRAALLASLVTSTNTYSRLRIDHYATADRRDWDRLPEWNPATRPIVAAELDGRPLTEPTAFEAVGLPDPEAISSERAPALVALGRVAFSRYPTQLAPELGVALASRETAARYGLWIDGRRGVGGLVRTQMADGSTAIALTCSSCHSAPGSEGVQDGPPNTSLDLGAAILATSPELVRSARVRAVAGWGPGRVDVSTTSGTEPVRIPDLRPVRFLSYLHHDATLSVHGLSTLAIRIETLVITSYGQVIRPPRLIALALAAYVDSLATTLPSISAADTASPAGSALFTVNCGSCHAPPGLTGAPIPLALVGTDPTVGSSLERGTGMYRVPSLRGVGSRKFLLHDGTVSSLDAMLDPMRPTADFTSRVHGQGAVPGHLFGLDLPDDDRQALLKFLRAL